MRTKSEIRQQNLSHLIGAATSMAAFGRTVDVRYNTLARLKAGKGETTADLCRKVEAALHLPARWMDEDRADLPEDIKRALREKTTRPGEREDGPAMSARRIQNVEWLVGSGHGAKAAFCDAVNWHASEFYMMKQRPLGWKRSQSIESRLQLPEGWLDLEHDHSAELPDSFEDRLDWARKKTGYRPPTASDAAATTAQGSLQLGLVQSPITRALIEKLLAVGAKNLLPEARALELLQEVVALER